MIRSIINKILGRVKKAEIRKEKPVQESFTKKGDIAFSDNSTKKLESHGFMLGNYFLRSDSIAASGNVKRYRGKEDECTDENEDWNGSFSIHLRNIDLSSVQDAEGARKLLIEKAKQNLDKFFE